MRVVWSWLRELCELERDVGPEEAAAALTGVGLEVEAIERLGENFSGVVVAEVAGKRPHPKADKLTLVDVVDERGAKVEVICGAPNVPEAGGRVLWARPGAVLPGGFEIGKKKLKGIESAGMICSEKELELGEDHQGIIVLEGQEGRAAPGTEAQEALGLRDLVFDIGTPANRPDLLGHLGVARELVAVVGGRLAFPETDPGELLDEAVQAAELVEVTIADPEACPRYTARILDGLTVRASPYWLRQRLTGVGVRPLSNLVDVTNYVMFELGQPLHAFDHARVRGARIDVRRAKPGEKMTTLDDVERELSQEDVVICDAGGPVALGGVMGGLESEVGAETRRVLLESANFDPLPIRRTARRLGLHSESSHRFERGVDPNGADRASARAARLLAELGGGKVAAGAVDAYPRRIEPRRVSMRASRASQLTGVELSRASAGSLLRRLSLEVEEKGDADLLEVNCPTFRTDLEREVDLIEEVLRMHGFDKVPSTLASTEHRPSRGRDRRPETARRALSAAGLCEAITFGFTSQERIEALRLPASDPRLEPLRLRNPMTVDQAVMRTSLLPNLLAAVAHNLNYDVEDVRLYEIGSVFFPRPGEPLPAEPLRAAGVLAGRRPGWLMPGEPVDFFDAKGASIRLLEAFLGPRAAAVETRATREIPYLHPGVAAELFLEDGTRFGEIGEVHPEVREAFGIGAVCFAFDFDLEALPAPAHRQMQPIPRHPAVVRDVSFFVSESVPAGQVRKLLFDAEVSLLEDVRCLEDYRDPDKVPEGQKGMLWSLTYRAPDRTLTDREVDAAHEPLVQHLLKTLQARRR